MGGDTCRRAGRIEGNHEAATVRCPGMIPAPVPVFPIAAILVATVGVFFYASFLAGRGTAKLERGSKAWVRGLAVAAIAVLLGVATAGLLVNILASHDRNYSQAVWVSLATEYGVQAAVDGQGIREGVPFPALLNGMTVECTLNLPRTVVCGGEPVAPIGG